MSEIEKALKSEERDFYMSNEERITLIEILSCVAVVLRTGKLHFNGRGKHNNEYAKLCSEIAKRFSNMPVHMEN